MPDNSTNFNTNVTLSREMHEEAVLQNLKRRFDRQIIYVILIAHNEHTKRLICIPLCIFLLFFLPKTYIGSILLSVNPYKMYNIYGTDMVLLYSGRALGENPP